VPGRTARGPTPLLRNCLRALSVTLALAECWISRHSMNPDGISYLDLGNVYFKGGWADINAYWSPLYAWLLGLNIVLRPDAYWEFAVAHLTNLCWLVFAASVRGLLDAVKDFAARWWILFHYFVRALQEASQTGSVF
jgi:hypothetical protein